jgi:polar amino acid transport system permease protein
MSGPAADSQPAGAPEAVKAVPVRHPGRWIAAFVITACSLSLVYSAATNDNFQWDVVGRYLFDSRILHGLQVTIELTVLAMVIGIVLGVVLALMRLSPNGLLSTVSWIYIWLFRGTPVLVQILFWNFFGAVYPTIALGVPFGPAFVHLNANSLITPFVAATLGLGLNEGAYMSEIIRAGIISVDEGQTEAAHALGMTRMQTMRRIVLPQAMRVIIPPTGNETISMLKFSSLASVIAVVELLYAGQLIYSVTYQQIPMLLVVSAWYLFLTSILSIGQFYLERYYGRGSTRAIAPTLLERILRGFIPRHAEVPRPPGDDEPPRPPIAMGGHG